MLFTDIVLIYMALMLVRFRLAVDDEKIQHALPDEKADGVRLVDHAGAADCFFCWRSRGDYACRCAVHSAAAAHGRCLPARYELVFLAAGVILFSLFVGVIMLPLLLQHIETGDSTQQHKEERIARAATAEVAIVAIQKMEERLAADTEENIDNQLLTEVSSRVIGNLRRRADGLSDVESSLQENLERRFRLAALRSERAERTTLRATRQISNETLQKLLHDLDLLEALLIENQ